MDGDLRDDLLYAKGQRYDEYRISREVVLPSSPGNSLPSSPLTKTITSLKEVYIIPIITKLAIDFKRLYDLKLIYSDAKLLNILFKIDPEGKIHVKLGDLGSIVNIDPMPDRDICNHATHPIPEYRLPAGKKLYQGGYECDTMEKSMHFLVWQLGIILIELCGFLNKKDDFNFTRQGALEGSFAEGFESVEKWYKHLNTQIDANTNIENAKLKKLREKIFRINDISELKIDLDGVLEILDPEGYSSGGYAD